MRWSQTFIPTMKESPAEAEIISTNCCSVPACCKLTGGLYTFLPAGLRALKKVEQIVREEMDRASAGGFMLECSRPTFGRNRRLESARDVLFHVKDRGQKDRVLAQPEEVITTMVSD